MNRKLSDKQVQRKFARSARDAIGSGLAARKSVAAVSRLLAHPAYHEAEFILAYQAHRGELDVSALCETALTDNKKVAFPVCDGQGGMTAAIADNDNLETDRYGITEPCLSSSRIILPYQLDMILVPGIAFDREGKRLGWGAGYYDRYLKLCGKAWFVAMAFEEQILEHITTDPWDKCVHVVVTDANIYSIAQPDRIVEGRV